MVRKIITYALLGLVALFVGGLVCSKDFRDECRIMWAVFTRNQVAKLEAQLDQGELALMRVDEAKAKAEQRLRTIRALQMDVEVNLRRTKEKAEDYRRSGKEDLALRNDEQARFMQHQLDSYVGSTERIARKLEEVKTIRMRAREDVRLARERIAILETAKSALDEEGMADMLQKAEQNISNLQSHCNKLAAEVEVLNMEE